jgi:hypothetical protein
MTDVEALQWAARTMLEAADVIDKRIHAPGARQHISHEDGVSGEGEIDALREHAARFAAEADRLREVSK